jgi:DNA-binding NarL/FixJ family response regulator
MSGGFTKPPAFGRVPKMMPTVQTRPTRILLVDDHSVVRAGVRSILQSQPDFALVGEAEEGLDAIRKTIELKPDVLVLDLVLRGVQGLEVLRQVREQARRTRVVVLSMHQDLAYVVEAQRGGALGYVLKAGPGDEIVKAVRAAMQGLRYVSPPLNQTDIDAMDRQMDGGKTDLYETLTKREREVCQFAAQGYTNDEIGGQLHISRRTVESHRFRMMHKLGLRNQAELVQFAIGRGVIPRPPGTRQ